jgi:release factor glutamine methyltransferase
MTQTEQQIWTVGKLLNWTADYFKTKSLDEPLLSAQILLANVLSCPKVGLYLQFEREVAENEKTEFRNLVKRAVEGEPIAYLTGHKEFFSIDFMVNSSVLIPRPETELLVQWVIRKIRSGTNGASHSHRILDIGTGSGCIPVALAKNISELMTILAVDISDSALALAEENSKRSSASNRIVFRKSDLFEQIDSSEEFDFIVSNPPYITEEDYHKLPRHIKDFEPQTALRGGSDGLDVIRRLCAEAGKYLKEGGYLVLEIGYNQSQEVKTLLSSSGYVNIEFEKDDGDIPRIAIGRKEF